MQDEQDARPELHPRDGEGGRVHLHVAERRRHPRPGRHLPRGTEEAVEVRHRSAGLQGAE